MIADHPHPVSPRRLAQNALEVAEGEGMIDRREGLTGNAGEEWWRAHHFAQPYAGENDYDDFAPAYRAGYNGYLRHGLDGCTFDEAEMLLRRDYESDDFWLRWSEVRAAALAAWNRIERRVYPLPPIH